VLKTPTPTILRQEPSSSLSSLGFRVMSPPTTDYLAMELFDTPKNFSGSASNSPCRYQEMTPARTTCRKNLVRGRNGSQIGVCPAFLGHWIAGTERMRL